MEIIGPAFGYGIFTANGKVWQHQRNSARNQFHLNKFPEYISSWEKHSQKVCSILNRCCQSNNSIDIQDLFMRFTLDSTGEILFGTNISSLDKEEVPFASAFDYVQAVCEYRSHPRGRWTKIFPNFKLQKASQLIRDFAYEIVQNTLKDPHLHERTDLLAQVVQNRDESMTIQYLVDMTLNFLVAGRDTTGVLLTWTFYFLQRHPEIEAKVLEEMQREIGDKAITMDNLSNLNYLKQVLNEVLRLCPSVPINLRHSIEDDTFPNGIFIEKGTDILWSPFILHRLPSLWGDDALVFDPDRWSPDRVKARGAFFYVPFNAGPRTCLGQFFALTEAKYLIVSILRNFSLKLVPNHVVRLKAAIILKSEFGMKMTVHKRKE